MSGGVVVLVVVGAVSGGSEGGPDPSGSVVVDVEAVVVVAGWVAVVGGELSAAPGSGVSWIDVATAGSPAAGAAAACRCPLGAGA